MKAKPRMLAPSECNTEAKVRRLRSDVVRTQNASMYLGTSPAGHVIIHDGNGGRLYMPFSDMRKFARWFLRKQRCK